MKFIPRLRKLEEHRRQHTPDCHVCGAGVGRHRRVVVLRDGEPQPSVELCPACGRDPLVIRVVYRTGANVLAQE